MKICFPHLQWSNLPKLRNMNHTHARNTPAKAKNVITLVKKKNAVFKALATVQNKYLSGEEEV